MANGDSQTTWLTLAEAEITRLQLDPELLNVLQAFGHDRAPGPASLDPQETAQDLPTAISESLSTEVDADQAQMFARRFVSVSELLVSQATPTSSLLRLGLYRRAHQILSVDPPPRALRIRALVDFIWSQALVLGRNDSSLPKLQDLVKDLVYDEFAPGFLHGTIEGDTCGGPVHINVLKIKKGATTMRTVDARTAGSTDLAILAEKYGASAAVSGGFFLYSEPDISPPSKRKDPVGLMVTDGHVVGPPVFKRAALLQSESGDITIEKLGMDGVRVMIGDAESQCFVVGSNGVRCIHRGRDEAVSLKKDEVGISVVGNRVVQVLRSTGNDRPIAVPLAGFVLVTPAAHEIQEGDLVSYRLQENFQAAMAGGPILIGGAGDIDLVSEDFCGSAPPVTFSQDETFDRNLLPRMGAGLTEKGDLILTAVDGRNLDKALGLTLRGTADLLSALGCTRAMNLDGGSSKRMVIKDKVVDLSTTEIKGEGEEQTTTPELSRPVHSAILFLPRQG